MNNAHIRQLLRQQRNQLSDTAQLKNQQRVLKHLKDSGLLDSNYHFAIYLHSDGELHTDTIIKQLFQLNKAVYLPVLHPDKSNHLLFIRYTASSTLTKNRFGIKEPSTIDEPVAITDLDIIFMPLVAFNHKGHRLGMGGGYYDRSLASLSNKQITKPLLIGLSHELQCNENFITHALDIPMDGIITEKNVRFISKALKTTVAK